jgi:hypothetical protein
MSSIDDFIVMRSRTLKIMFFLLALYFLLWIPYLFWPNYLDSPPGIIVIIPIMSIYVFDGVGIPGLLLHDGACGWGRCAPTAFGWFFIISFWLVMLWLFARLIITLNHQSRRTSNGDP